MKKNKFIYSTFIVFLLISCNTKDKKNSSAAYVNQSSQYFGSELAKIPFNYIIGKWNISSIQFSEHAINKKNEAMYKSISITYIKQSDRIPIEFMKDGKLLVNNDTVGIWFEKENQLVLSGKVTNTKYPFFLNTSYRVGKNKLSGILTCFFSDSNGPHHQVKYILLKEKNNR